MHSCRAWSIYATWVDPNALLWCIHRATQYVWFIMAMYPFISSDPRVIVEMHPEALLEPVYRNIWRPWSSEVEDAHGGRDRANLEVIIVQHWRHTWRLRSNEFGDALGGYDWAWLEDYKEAVNLEEELREGGPMGAYTLFIGRLVIVWI